ncbi:MAG: DUF6370 family protein [Daejeonella sp.]
MRNLFFILLFTVCGTAAFSQSNPTVAVTPSKEIKNQIVETACGECRFDMKGKSCDLAVKINGSFYFVDGTNIDDHGDAHANDGLCEKVRKAEVSGKIVNGRFLATSFKILPEEEKKSN